MVPESIMYPVKHFFFFVFGNLLFQPFHKLWKFDNKSSFRKQDDKTKRQQDNNSGGKTWAYEAAQLTRSLKSVIFNVHMTIQNEKERIHLLLETN
jgi:hypothetical protein